MNRTLAVSTRTSSLLIADRLQCASLRLAITMASVGLFLASHAHAQTAIQTAILPDAPQPAVTNSDSPVSVKKLGISRQFHPLTVEEKFQRFERRTISPPAFILPALNAGIRMAAPPSGYPKEWKDGAGAFGRLYGSTFTRQFTKHGTEFAVESVLHYDPRYFRSNSKGIGRVGHALAFVLIQKTDSGKNAIAVPHLAGATASSFIGMAYLPDGYNDAGYSAQHFGTEMMMTGMRNMLFEFSPEIYPVFKKMHMGRIVPTAWKTEAAAKSRKTSSLDNQTADPTKP